MILIKNSKTSIIIRDYDCFVGLGQNIKTFWESLKREASLVHQPECYAKIKDLSMVNIGKIQCKKMDRSAIYLLQALDNMLLKNKEYYIENADTVGLFLCTNFGGIEYALKEADKLIERGSSKVGPYLSIPMFFASCVGQASIVNKFTGTSTLLCNGKTSVFEAINLSQAAFDTNAISSIIVGACEMPFVPLVEEVLKTINYISKQNSQQLLPFGQNLNGTILAEGAAVICLEEEEFAIANGHDIVARIESFAECESSSLEDNICKSMLYALENAGIIAEEIDLVVANANGHEEHDQAEALALDKVFGGKVPVTSIRQYIGDMYTVSPLVDLIVAIEMMKEDIVIPIKANHNKLMLEEKINYVKKVETIKLNRILINSIDISGKASTLVIEKNKILL